MQKETSSWAQQLLQRQQEKSVEMRVRWRRVLPQAAGWQTGRRTEEGRLQLFPPIALRKLCPPPLLSGER